MILCFTYNIQRNNLYILLEYEYLDKNRNYNTLIKKLIIPKINRNKKSNYSKKFKDNLNNIHLGELIYGQQYDLNINTDISLDITIHDEEININNDIINTVDIININHNCYYYIKNKNIPNKILCNGMINYKS